MLCAITSNSLIYVVYNIEAPYYRQEAQNLRKQGD